MPRGSLNFRGNAEFTKENVGRALDELWDFVSKVQSGQTIVKAINSAISNSSIVSGTPGFEYRTGSISVSAGTPTITFSSALSSTGYKVIAYLMDSDGYVQPLGSPTSQSLTGFTYTLTTAGTITYFAFLVQ